VPAPYSLDLRERVVLQYSSGEFTQEEISELFGISSSTIKRWLRRQRETDDLSPIKGNNGRPAKIDSRGLLMLEEAVKENNTITLDALSKLYLKKFKVKAGRSVLSRAMAKLNLNRKKLSVKALEKSSPEAKKKISICASNKAVFI